MVVQYLRRIGMHIWIPILSLCATALAGCTKDMSNKSGPSHNSTGTSNEARTKVERDDEFPDSKPVSITKQPTTTMVPIPAGEFIMGSDKSRTDAKPARRVYLDAFKMDKTEVTVVAYKACVDTGTCSVPMIDAEFCRDTFANMSNWAKPGRENHPINCVSWHQAKTFCKWAGKRLPTEAQWEKAARGVNPRTFPWGELAPSCESAVLHDGVARGCGKGTTWPVASKPLGASTYGVLDMAGSVSEWTEDGYDGRQYYDAPNRNPRGSPTSLWRVYRGGNFDDGPTLQPVTHRYRFVPTWATTGLGFRCVK